MTLTNNRIILTFTCSSGFCFFYILNLPPCDCLQCQLCMGDSVCPSGPHPGAAHTCPPSPQVLAGWHRSQAGCSVQCAGRIQEGQQCGWLAGWGRLCGSWLAVGDSSPLLLPCVYGAVMTFTLDHSTTLTPPAKTTHS